MINALLINEKDNIAVAIKPIGIGREICYSVKDGTVKTLTALDNNNLSQSSLKTC